MNKRDTPPLPRGAILRPQLAQRAFDLRRVAPPAALVPFVAHFWFIDWELDAPFTQSVLPNPAVNLVSEADQLSLSGIWTRRYDRHLEGRGSVYGLNFRPAGFYALWRRPLHALTNATRDLAPELGLDAAALHRELGEAPDDAARVARLAALLETFTFEAAPYPLMEALNDLVELARTDRELLRAEALAERGGMSLRSLQRKLREHVGVGPKALIRRFRLQEAAARLRAAEDDELPKFPELALALGYADQAHFIRDFKATVGASPAAYARSLRADL